MESAMKLTAPWRDSLTTLREITMADYCHDCKLTIKSEGSVMTPEITYCPTHARASTYEAALRKIVSEIHPHDLKQVEGRCSGCIAEESLSSNP
jgi:hypothetical protein